jgi:hypothetical protein
MINIKEDIGEEDMKIAVSLVKQLTNLFRCDNTNTLTSDEVAHLASYVRFIIDVDEGNISEEEFEAMLSVINPENSNQLH